MVIKSQEMEKSALSISTAAGLAIFKKAVTDGVPPEDIAKNFGMTVSNVHYHKKKLKDQGIEFPNVRGKRPTMVVFKKVLPSGDIVDDDYQPDRYIETKKSGKLDDHDLMELIDNTEVKADYKITINGTVFFISGLAKEIHINGKESIEVNF